MELRRSEKCAIVITALFFALVLGYSLGERRDSRVVITELEPPSQAAAVSEQPSERAQEKININTATAAELESLEGIGPVLARRIIEFREENGGFDRIEDITLVSGIASEVYEDIRDCITVD